MKPGSPPPPPLLDRLTALTDLARLRMLRLLEGAELSVGELAKAVQLPQSTVSRHLKLLHDGGWIVRHTEGTASLYRLAEQSLDAEARDLWHLVRGQLSASPTLEEDDRRLAEVLAERRTDSKAFFGRIGGEWDALRHELFGEAFTTEAMLSLVGRDWTVADLGCGTGNAAEHLAPVVKRVIAVDREPAMLEAAGKRLANLDNVEFRQGDLMGTLPIDDGEIDAAVVFLVMVYLPDPQHAVGEIARVLRPGGLAMIVDMVAHDRETLRHTMGHLHLGFDAEQVRGWAAAAGLEDVRYRRLRPDTQAKGPGLFVAIMSRPG
jgi:ArsR family transcriptional regulator